jgi:hypothetical protein
MKYLYDYSLYQHVLFKLIVRVGALYLAKNKSLTRSIAPVLPESKECDFTAESCLPDSVLGAQAVSCEAGG